MSYRRYQRSKPTVMTITVKYAGKCACCGGIIPVGSIADYYPVGTIAGVHESRIAHLKAMEGESQACSAVLKAKLDNPTADLDTRWEDDCKERCGL